MKNIFKPRGETPRGSEGRSTINFPGARFLRLLSLSPGSITRTRPFLRSTASWPWDARVMRALQAVGLEARSCSRRARGICDQDTEALELLNAIADESAAIQGNPPICQGHPWGLWPPVNASYTGRQSTGAGGVRPGTQGIPCADSGPMPLPQRSQPDAEDKFYDSTGTTCA
jgi:hypothetical protein